MACNCEYCVECDCGHKADEHLAGDGNCFICDCGRFKSEAVNAWDRLSIAEQSTWEFKKFIDNYIKENSVVS